MTAESSSTRDILALIDAGSGALGRHDRHAAAANYAKASELLFAQAAGASEVGRKAEFARRAQQLLLTARSLRGEALSPQAGAVSGERAPQPQPQTGLTFADVAGLDEVKETLRIRMIYPLGHPEKLAQYGLRAGGGMLLFGPPGTGKTMIAKAVAGELELPFFAVKPSEILGKYVGESEQRLAALFDEARQNPRGAIVFVDEIDAIGVSRASADSDAARRLLTQLLQELDGFQARATGLLFLAATNEPWLLDTALLRPGRFDEKCYVPLPDEPARLQLLKLQLAGCMLAAGVSLAEFAHITDGYSGADLTCLCQRAKQIPFREAVLNGRDRPLTADDLKQALGRIRPSVDSASVRRYREYAEV